MVSSPESTLSVSKPGKARPSTRIAAAALTGVLLWMSTTAESCGDGQGSGTSAKGTQAAPGASAAKPETTAQSGHTERLDTDCKITESPIGTFVISLVGSDYKNPVKVKYSVGYDINGTTQGAKDIKDAKATVASGSSHSFRVDHGQYVAVVTAEMAWQVSANVEESPECSWRQTDRIAAMGTNPPELVPLVLGGAQLQAKRL